MRSRNGPFSVMPITGEVRRTRIFRHTKLLLNPVEFTMKNPSRRAGHRRGVLPLPVSRKPAGCPDCEYGFPETGIRLKPVDRRPENVTSNSVSPARLRNSFSGSVSCWKGDEAIQLVMNVVAVRLCPEMNLRVSLLSSCLLGKQVAGKEKSGRYHRINESLNPIGGNRKLKGGQA